MDTIIDKVEEVPGINQEAPVSESEAPVEAETAPETVVEPVVEETVEATPEAVAEAPEEPIDLGWQKGVHYF